MNKYNYISTLFSFVHYQSEPRNSIITWLKSVIMCKRLEDEKHFWVDILFPGKLIKRHYRGALANDIKFGLFECTYLRCSAGWIMRCTEHDIYILKINIFSQILLTQLYVKNKDAIFHLFVILWIYLQSKVLIYC